jgi:hypothetical protein
LILNSRGATGSTLGSTWCSFRLPDAHDVDALKWRSLASGSGIALLGRRHRADEDRDALLGWRWWTDECRTTLLGRRWWVNKGRRDCQRQRRGSQRASMQQERTGKR